MNAKKTLIFKILSMVFIVIAIVLEALPYGVKLNFVAEGQDTIWRSYSYFDITPFGYGSFTPLITAVLTVLLAAASVVLLIIKRNIPTLNRTLFIVEIITAIISVCPALYGLDYVTPVGCFITVTLAVSAVFCLFANILSIQDKNVPADKSYAAVN